MIKKGVIISCVLMFNCVKCLFCCKWSCNTFRSEEFWIRSILKSPSSTIGFEENESNKTSIVWINNFNGTKFLDRYRAIMCKFGIGSLSTVIVISTLFLLYLKGVFKQKIESFPNPHKQQIHKLFSQYW